MFCIDFCHQFLSECFDFHQIYEFCFTYGMIPYNTMGAIDQVIANSYIDAIRSISVKNTWDFIPPDIVSVDVALTDWSSSANGLVVCNYTTIHKTLDCCKMCVP